MLTSASCRRRTRPVADAPALDGTELARAWLVELVAAAPLDRAARLPGPRFAQDAPRLCAAVAAALASDAAWRDLEPGGRLAPLAAHVAGLVAAPGALDVVAALDALRSVVWTAVLDALHRPVPAQVADLADRLGAVMATLAAAAVAMSRPLDETPADTAATPRTGQSGRGSGPEPGAAVDAGAAAPPRDPGATARAARCGAGGAVAGAPEADGAGRPSVRVEDHGTDGPRGRRGPAAPPRPAGAGERPSPAPPAVPPRRDDVNGAPSPVPARAGDGRGPGPHPPADGATAPPGDVLAQVEATLREAAHAADPLREAAERLRRLARDVDLRIEPEPDEAPATETPGAPPGDVAPGDAGDGAARGRTGDAVPREVPAAATRAGAVGLDATLDGLRVRRLGVDDAAAGDGRRAAPWSAAIRRRLERHRDDGRPFGVLCVEIGDVERLVAAGDDGIAAALEAAEAAVLERLRPADALIPERSGRYWLIAPDTDPQDAVSLAHRIAEAVAGVPARHGAPLQATVGVSTCPADAQSASRLEALAEEALYAARAAGVRVCGARG